MIPYKCSLCHIYTLCTNRLAEVNKSIAAAKENTQNRIIQELPGCNWLEQKIKGDEGSHKRTR